MTADNGGPNLLRDEIFYRQRDTMLSLANTVDDALGNITDIFDRNRDLGARIVKARDEAESGMLQLSGHIASIHDMYTDLRKEQSDSLAAAVAGINDVLGDLCSRMSVLEERMDTLPSTSPIPPLQAIRTSLAALERSAKTRLSNHAASLADS